MKPVNILLVDDSKTIQAIIAKTIKISGIPVSNIYFAQNGSEAFSVIRRESIDIMITDLKMPIMDGHQLIANLHGIGLMDKLKVFVVTSEGKTKKIQLLKRMGINGYLRKPFTPEQLYSAITDKQEVILG